MESINLIPEIEKILYLTQMAKSEDAEARPGIQNLEHKLGPSKSLEWDKAVHPVTNLEFGKSNHFQWGRKKLFRQMMLQTQ